MVDIRALGRLPKEFRHQTDENQRSESALALRLRRLREYISEVQQEELDSLSVAAQHAATGVGELMDFIRTFKRLPRRHPKPKTASAWEAKEHRLHHMYDQAHKRDWFTSDQLEEIRNLRADALSVAPQHAVTEVMDFIRTFRRLPRRHRKLRNASAWEAEEHKLRSCTKMLECEAHLLVTKKMN